MDRSKSLPNLLVNQLIDHNIQIWNSQAIEQVLYPIDVEKVKRISISQINEGDKIVWLPSKSGKVSIKVAYKFDFKSTALAYKPTTSNSIIPIAFWNNLWPSPLPPKIKVWVWRTVRDKLPTKIKLLRHGLKVNGLHSLCKLDPKT